MPGAAASNAAEVIFLTVRMCMMYLTDCSAVIFGYDLDPTKLFQYILQHACLHLLLQGGTKLSQSHDTDMDLGIPSLSEYRNQV